MKHFTIPFYLKPFLISTCLILLNFISISAYSQSDSVKTKLRKHRIALVSNGINSDHLLGAYTEIGLSHEGHITGTSSLSLHATYLTNNVAKGLVLRPEIRFYLKKYKALDEGFYISLGGSFSYVAGNKLPGVDSSGYVNLYRLGLMVGAGYQHTFENGIFINAGVITGIATGLYQVDNSGFPTNQWYTEEKAHPLYTQLTALLRIGYAF
jgi:hypothetical protein